MTGLFFYTFHPKTFAHYLYRWRLAKESGRLFLLRESIRLMFSHPVKGIGLGNYRFYTQRYIPYRIKEKIVRRPARTAHNAYLNFGAETGVLGFIVITLLIFYPFYRYLWLFFPMRKYFKLFPENKELGFLYCVGFSFGLFLILISFFNVFYIDAGYIFWTVYIFSLLISYEIKDIILMKLART